MRMVSNIRARSGFAQTGRIVNANSIIGQPQDQTHRRLDQFPPVERPEKISGFSLGRENPDRDFYKERTVTRLHHRHAQLFSKLNLELIARSQIDLLTFLGKQNSDTDCKTYTGSDHRSACPAYAAAATR